MSAMKDVLLLDVDGVLNVPLAYPTGSAGIRMGGLTFFPAQFAKKFMDYAWENFDVLWLTAWSLSANFIAKWAKLPHAPVLYNQRPLDPDRDWKVVAAEKALLGDGRRIFWVEDGFTDEAVHWAERRGNVFLVETNPAVGVTEETIRLL